MSSYGGNWATEKVEMEKLADGTMWINQSLVYFKNVWVEIKNWVQWRNVTSYSSKSRNTRYDICKSVQV